MTRQTEKLNKQDTQPLSSKPKSNRGCLIGSVAVLGLVIIGATIFLWKVLPLMNQPLGEPLNLPETTSTQDIGKNDGTPEVNQTENSTPPICGDVSEMTLAGDWN